MTLKEILAVSGQPGLHKLVASSKTGIIVESLETKKRMPISASAKVSSLSDIAIFTVEEEKPLVDILKALRTKYSSQQAISHKAKDNELKELFAEILPEYDRDRVYLSDIKKIIQWYNILQSSNLLDLLDVVEETSAEEQSNP